MYYIYTILHIINQFIFSFSLQQRCKFDVFLHIADANEKNRGANSENRGANSENRGANETNRGVNGKTDKKKGER